jgi:D-beta-D-heptose 7-phosphate kinase / D-beta-D-heptose 1-phosphate adenosyltransferase
MSIQDMVFYIRDRSFDRRIVFTNGCFDLLHPGHLDTIEFAREVATDGGMVVVGVNSDASVSKLKSASRPILDEVARARIVESLKDVDVVVIFNEDEPYALLDELMPHAIVKGGDYSGREYSKSSEYAPVFYAPYNDKYSTTKLISKASVAAIDPSVAITINNQHQQCDKCGSWLFWANSTVSTFTLR